MIPLHQKIVAKLAKEQEKKTNFEKVSLMKIDNILSDVRADEIQVDNRLQKISDLGYEINQEKQRLKKINNSLDKYILELNNESAKIDKMRKEMQELGINTSNLIPYTADIKRGFDIITKLEKKLLDIK